jgi:hypothetical protein
MSPQGRLELVTGFATCLFQITDPVEALSAYSVPFSVAATTRPATTSGCAETAPSSGRCQAVDSVPGGGTPAAAPVLPASRPNCGQSAGDSAVAGWPGVAAAVLVGTGDDPDDDVPAQPASSPPQLMRAATATAARRFRRIRTP